MFDFAGLDLGLLLDLVVCGCLWLICVRGLDNVSWVLVCYFGCLICCWALVSVLCLEFACCLVVLCI